MFESTLDHRNKKRRAVIVSTSLVAMLVAGGLAFAFVEKVRDAADRAT